MARIYPYLSAGLPVLSLQADVKGFDYAQLYDQVLQNLSAGDAKLLRFLSTGLESQAQTPYLYIAAAKNKSRFIREYFAYDRLLRNAGACIAAEKIGVEPNEYLVGTEYPETIPADIKQVLDMPDLLERERKIDALRWEKVSEITIFNYLDIDYLLAFIVKASLINRWLVLDKTKGEAMFKQLVEEVRGTFDIRKTTV